jgi:membrane protein
MEVIKRALKLWWHNDPMSAGAALAFYALFSLPPLIIIGIALSSAYLPGDFVEGRADLELQHVFGRQVSQGLIYLVHQAQEPTSSLIATAVGLVTILVGALAIFGQLQASLDKLWGVDSSLPVLTGYVRNKLISFIMVTLLGILLLISLTASTIMTVFDRSIRHFFPYTFDLVQYFDSALSFVLIVILCMAIYAFMPQIRVSRHALFMGGVLTALLFIFGRIIIGIYLAWDITLSAYGAASALIILMIWIYYSSQVFLFGAAVTYSIDHKVKSEHYGSQPPNLG